MDHQRTTFYGMRQKVLLGREIDKVIWDMISQAINDAVDKYIVEDHIANVLVEWTRSTFETVIEPEDFRGVRRLEEIEELIRSKAKVEAESNIASTMGEFMGENAANPEEWDTKGLANWATTRFGVKISPTTLQTMDPLNLEETLRTAALEQIDKRDCSQIVRYLEPLYSEGELCNWAQSKFGIEIKPEELMADVGRGVRKPAGDISEMIETRARQAYAVREILYPTGQALTYAAGGSDKEKIDNPYAAEFVRNWVYTKYRVGMPVEHILATTVDQLHDELVALQREYTVGGKMQKEVEEILRMHQDHAAIVAEFNQRFGTSLIAKELDKAATTEGGVKGMLLARGKAFFRQELTDLEQYVLINIFDQTWKDHLYAMDMLKGSVGLHAYAEKDPRILYKKEGYRYFEEMMIGVRDKVTDLIFRVNVVGQTKAKNAYQVLAASHEEVQSYGVSETIEKSAQEMKEASGAAQGEGARVKAVVRDAPKVGRNDPCPCGSGKKYKKCHGVNVA